jgi:hypothetical protein
LFAKRKKEVILELPLNIGQASQQCIILLAVNCPNATSRKNIGKAMKIRQTTNGMRKAPVNK